MLEKLIYVFENETKDTFTKKQIIEIIKREIDNQFVDDVESGDIKLVYDGLKLIQGDSIKFLPNKVFKVLHFLIKNKNKCMSREMILKNCWENDVYVCERTIDVHINKIKNFLNNKTALVTRKKVGYVWEEK